MKTLEDRLSSLQAALSERILILDGAMGTMIQAYQLQEQDYRGDLLANHHKDLKGNNDLLTLTRPDVIAAIYQATDQTQLSHIAKSICLMAVLASSSSRPTACCSV